MNKSWNLGYAFGIARRLYAPLVTLLCLFMGYSLAFKEQVQVVPTTFFIDDKGAVKIARCDPQSPLNKPVMERLVSDLGRTLFQYKKGQSPVYAAQYESFKPFIAEGSPASEKVYPFVFDEIGGEDLRGKVSRQSSSFQLLKDTKGTLFKVTNTGNGKWKVLARGEREILSSAGKSRSSIEIRAIIIEGDHNAIYKVYSYDIDDNPIR